MFLSNWLIQAKWWKNIYKCAIYEALEFVVDKQAFAYIGWVRKLPVKYFEKSGTAKKETVEWGSQRFPHTIWLGYWLH